MSNESTTDADRVRQLADRLDCLLDEDLQLLTGTKPSTTEAWRRRGEGPPFVRIGNRTLYPREAVREYFQSRVRVPSRSVRDLL